MPSDQGTSEFNWSDEAVCRQYVEMRDIATDRVHYGWLAPGEDELGLLAGLPECARVLDIGCGAGENLLALACKGHECYGIDIAPAMLECANEKFLCSGVLPEALPALHECDMRNMVAFQGIRFDLVLSVYSLEFLDSLKEMRDVLGMVYARLKPEGRFLCCVSHPLQHNAHRNLLNETGRTGCNPGDPLTFSFRDTVKLMTEVGFVIDRIVEQQTLNPSQITYQESLRYPYRFAEGKNPCRAEFDHISNCAPHTVIYSVSRPMPHSSPPTSDLATGSLGLEFGEVVLWGKRRTVTDRWTMSAGGRIYDVLELAPYDSLVAFCILTDLRVDGLGKRDAGQPAIRKVRLDNGGFGKLQRGSALELVDQKLRQMGCKPAYRRQNFATENGAKEWKGIYLHRVDPVYGELSQRYHERELGILLLVNNAEPGSGMIGMNDYFPIVGDSIQVLYAVTGWGSEWRSIRPGQMGEQLSLPILPAQQDKSSVRGKPRR